MEKIYTITYRISIFFVFLILFISIISIFILTKFTDLETPTYSGITYLSSPFFLLSLFTLEYYVRSNPKKQSTLTKFYFFSSLLVSFIIFMVIPNFVDKRGLDLISGPSVRLNMFFITSLIYLLLSFLIVSKTKVKVDEINWDEVLNQLKEEVKKEDEEFLNKLIDSLKNMDDRGWKYPPPMK